MRLAVKTTSAVFLVLLIVLAVDGVASVRREEGLFVSDLRHDGLLVGKTMARALSEVWQARGERRTLALVEEADREDEVVRIRWVWLDSNRPDHQPTVGLDRLGSLPLGTTKVIDQTDPSGTRWTHAYIPVQTGGPDRGALEVSESTDAARAYTRTTLMRQGILAGAIALLGGLALALVSRRLIATPLERMMDKIERIGEGDLTGPMGDCGRDELARLARTLDAMCDHLAEARKKTRAEALARRKTQEQLEHSERLATVGRLSAGLAHELGTPLNVVAGRAQLIARAPGSAPAAREGAEIIIGQTKRMARIIRELLDFARRRPPAPSATDLKPLLRNVIELLRPEAETSGVTLSLVADVDIPPAWADRAQLEQVFLNLVVNGIQAMDNRGEVTIVLSGDSNEDPGRGAERDRSRHLVVEVVDTGCGIAAEHIPHLFDPFFTTKTVGKGTGLGLSIVYGIVREHGGWIDVTSTPGQGSRFTVHIPTAGPDAHRAAKGSPLPGATLVSRHPTTKETHHDRHARKS